MNTRLNIGLIVITALLAACGDHAGTTTGNEPEPVVEQAPGNVHEVANEEELTYQYTGTAQTVEGRRALIWEFADSEAYYLDEDSVQAWPAELEGTEITIDGLLVQKPGEKSIITSWKILD